MELASRVVQRVLDGSSGVRDGIDRSSVEWTVWWWSWGAGE